MAKLLAGLGFEVTGSDTRIGEGLAAVGDLGIEVWAGHRPEGMAAADLVVASSAVPDADPELMAALALGIPTWRRPELLEAITATIPTIGPTGTHGKTSSTALMVDATRAAGLDASFVVGGEMLGYRTNAAVGSDDLLILEVDEAFGTFESVRLTGLMVTNLEPDHLDHFGTPEAMEEAFVRVVRAVDGPVVVCSDDPGAARLAAATGALTYGLAGRPTYRMAGLSTSASTLRFRLEAPGLSVPIVLPRPGIHLARNAAGVIALLAELGIDPEAGAAGMAGFQGVRRRFEHRGTVAGVSVIDDYAHHPTEVGATLDAARQLDHRRVWGVFQPHLYSRTELMHNEFGDALARADRVVVTDIYGAREEPRPGITGALVADAAALAGVEVDYVPHRAELAGFLADRVEPGDLVVNMGAGDISVVPGELLRLLSERS